MYSRFFLLLLAVVPRAISLGHLDVVYQWRTVDYEFPNESERQNFIQRGDFIQGTNSLPLDVDVWHYGDENIDEQIVRGYRDSDVWHVYMQLRTKLVRYVITIVRIFYGYHEKLAEEYVSEDNNRLIFVTLPKFQQGIPASLVTVSDNKRGDSYLLRPFPDWSWHYPVHCEGMISVFRTQIDKCGRLWAIDSGMVDLNLPTRRRQCQPKLLAFQLNNNNNVAVRHAFPDNLLRGNSLLTNVAVDVRDERNNCLDTFAYASDTTEYGLLVLDVRRNRSWRVQANSMYPYPEYGLFKTNNVEFNLMDGILGMALTPPERRSNDRTLFYHSLASVRESWVPTSILMNEDNFTPNQNFAYRQFKTSDEARKAQAIAQSFDKNGVLYFGMVDNTLNCWNHRSPFTRENIHEIARDNQNLQFASGLKVIMNEDDEEEIWVITNRFQAAAVNQMQANETNFRIVRGKLHELIRNSRCKGKEEITFPNKPLTNTNKPQISYGGSNAYQSQTSYPSGPITNINKPQTSYSGTPTNSNRPQTSYTGSISNTNQPQTSYGGSITNTHKGHASFSGSIGNTNKGHSSFGGSTTNNYRPQISFFDDHYERK